VLFLVVLLIFQKTSLFKNTKISNQENNTKNGLTYDENATILDLVDKDTDSDGIPDWQESLYGLDPNKKETTLGTPDSITLSKLRAEQEKKAGASATIGGPTGAENLTQTDKFSRELFATVTALSQNGQVDQETIDALSNSLSDKIENSTQRKIYRISDIKIINTETKLVIQKYSDSLNNIYIKHRIKKGVPAILEEFIADETNTAKLAELDSVINQTNQIINESLKLPVPQSLSLLHLNLINNSQKIKETVSDLKLFENDPIVAIGAIVQYEKNAFALTSSAKNLTDTIKQKLNN
jgi:hypothetical protein